MFLSQTLPESNLFMNLQRKNSGDENLGSEGQPADRFIHVHSVNLLPRRPNSPMELGMCGDNVSIKADSRT